MQFETSSLKTLLGAESPRQMMPKFSSFSGQHSGRAPGPRCAEEPPGQGCHRREGAAPHRRALEAELRAGNGRNSHRDPRDTAGRLWGTAPRHFLRLSTTPAVRAEGASAPRGRGESASLRWPPQEPSEHLRGLRACLPLPAAYPRWEKQLRPRTPPLPPQPLPSSLSLRR